MIEYQCFATPLGESDFFAQTEYDLDSVGVCGIEHEDTERVFRYAVVLDATRIVETRKARATALDSSGPVARAQQIT